MKAVLTAVLLCVAASCLAQQRLVEPGAPDSARPTATLVLRHLAEGNIEAAAALSNAPQGRLQVLRDYRKALGEEDFKRVFAQYLNHEVVAEVALGRHRLLVWHLVGTEERLAGQFYVEDGGRFLMDDVPSEARSELRRILGEYRKKMGSDPTK